MRVKIGDFASAVDRSSDSQSVARATVTEQGGPEMIFSHLALKVLKSGPEKQDGQRAAPYGTLLSKQNASSWFHRSR
jgi:hypothetical protein